MKIPKWLHNLGFLMVAMAGSFATTQDTDTNGKVLLGIVGGIGTIILKIPVKEKE